MWLTYPIDWIKSSNCASRGQNRRSGEWPAPLQLCSILLRVWLPSKQDRTGRHFSRVTAGMADDNGPVQAGVNALGRRDTGELGHQQPADIHTDATLNGPGQLWIRPGWVKIIHTDASLRGRILPQQLLQFAQALADGLEIIGNPGHVFSPNSLLLHFHKSCRP